MNITFDEPKSLEGIIAYFRLSHYLGAAAYAMGDYEAYEQFYTGKAVVSVGWILDPTQHSHDKRSAGKSGNQTHAGLSFCWRKPTCHLEPCPRTRKRRTQIHRIPAKPKRSQIDLSSVWLTVRQSTWNNPPFDSDHYQVLMKAIQKGRGFPFRPVMGSR